MAQQDDIFDPTLFVHYPPRSMRHRPHPLLNRFRKSLDCWFRRHRDACAATLAIAAVMLAAIYLFLRQLAEFGW